MANGSADSTARLENWFWTQSPPLFSKKIDVPFFSGKIFDDPPPRSWTDGTSISTSIVSEGVAHAYSAPRVRSFVVVEANHAVHAPLVEPGGLERCWLSDFGMMSASRSGC